MLILLWLYPFLSMASWKGPTKIIHAAWGDAPYKFGFNQGDTRDQFPINVLIMTDGKIIIEDWVNNKLKIYNERGKYIKFIRQPGLGMFELSNDKIIGFAWDDSIKGERIGVYGLEDGTWIWKDKDNVFDSATTKVKVELNIIYVWDQKFKGYKYNQDGQVLQKYQDKPALFESGIRDADGNEYHIDHNRVIRKDHHSKKEKPLQINLPDRNGSEHGRPMINRKGDVFVWHKTSRSYAVLKWTWVPD